MPESIELPIYSSIFLGYYPVYPEIVDKLLGFIRDQGKITKHRIKADRQTHVCFKNFEIWFFT